MFDFILVALIFTLAAVMFVIPPLLLRQNYTEESRQTATNILIYKERLRELEQEFQAQQVNLEDFTERKQELEKNLAQELNSREINYKSKWRWASVIMVIILIPSLAWGMYWKLGNYNLLQPTSTPAHQVEFEQMIADLAQRLEQNPDDIEGWYMLARSYTITRRYAEAITVYNRLVVMTEHKNPDILVDYAETVAMTNENKLSGLPTVLLGMALEAEPEHPSALWLMGFAAREQQQFDQAIEYWQRLLPLVPESETDALKSLQHHIQEAKQALAPSTATFVDAKHAIRVKITIAEELELNATDVLFVYAVAETPMPIAIIRLPGSSLPTQVILDDSHSLMPDLPLSNFATVNIIARVSKTGEAKEQPGDFKGMIQNVELGKSVQVLIDKVI
jgi:cytochrome c-type biogenesis protein CcmH